MNKEGSCSKPSPRFGVDSNSPLVKPATKPDASQDVEPSLNTVNTTMNTTTLKSAFSLRKNEVEMTVKAADVEMTNVEKSADSSENEAPKEPEVDVSMHGVADPPTPIKRRSYLSKRLSLQAMPRP